MRVKWQEIAVFAFLIITGIVVARIWFWEDPSSPGCILGLTGPSEASIFLVFSLCLFLAVAFAFALAGFSRTAGYAALSRQVIRRRP